MRAREPILLLGFGASREALAKRLRLLNFHPVGAESPGEAVRECERQAQPVRVALVPVAPADPALAAQAIGRSGPPLASLELVAVGPRPAPEERAALREDGVQLALWEPFNDGELRYMVNEALSGRESAARRHSPRVPCSLLARVVAASGTRSAFVYSLSVGGAFLETHRPASPKARVRIELPLPERRIVADAVVVQTNVPGNLHRANLPMGMGLRFEPLPEEDRAALERFVEERCEELRV